MTKTQQANQQQMFPGRIRLRASRLQEAVDYIKFVNSLNLEDIIFYDDDMYEFVPTKEVVKQWKSAGLNNIFFAQEHGIIND